MTRCLLDLQPGLSVVLAATTGANTDRYLHGPRGIHAQRAAADNWEWMVQDGLGSVRGVADNTGVVQWSGSYGPYGSDFGDVGVSQTPYGFTGEPTNETSLVHLRARDYNPALGIFTALDPFEGMTQRPMSLNGYSWVEGNPVMNIDPRGLFPNINEIGTVYDYSCNCGWIDWNHVSKSDERVYTLLDDIEFAKSNQVLDPTGNVLWSIYFGVPLSFPVTVDQLIRGGVGEWIRERENDLFGKFATFPQDTLNRLSISDLAISIFMDANEQFEELQLAAINNLPGGLDVDVPGLGNPREVLESSYFSEEDLVSNLLGFYIALGRWKSKNAIPLTTAQMKERVKELCHVLSVNDSREVFQQAYQNGALAERNWAQWRPRLMPLEGNCGDKCPANRSFPSEIDQVKMGRVLPNVEGSWWWIDSFEELTMWGIVRREFIPDIRQNVAVRSPFE